MLETIYGPERHSLITNLQHNWIQRSQISLTNLAEINGHEQGT